MSWSWPARPPGEDKIVRQREEPDTQAGHEHDGDQRDPAARPAQADRDAEHTQEQQSSGDEDLNVGAEQVRRFLSYDIDARGWPDVADRDPVVADAQRRPPGLRPCGFRSPYEAAAWSVLS